MEAGLNDSTSKTVTHPLQSNKGENRDPTQCSWLVSSQIVNVIAP